MPSQLNFICDVCDKDCGYPNNLAIHRRRKHGLRKNEIAIKMENNDIKEEFINEALLTEQEDLYNVSELADEYSISLEEESPEDKPDLSLYQGLVPCSSCEACNKKDCLSCKYCLDMKKYGGPGKINKSCITRKCTQPENNINENLDENCSDVGGDFKPEVIHEYLKRITEKPRKRTRWRNGAPPSYWVWGKYICEVCGRECGYANNLNTHRKRKHGLKSSSKPEFKRKSMKPREPSSDQIIKQIAKKLQQTETQRAMPCKQCSACNSVDCLACKWCLDRKKYGGPAHSPGSLKVKFFMSSKVLYTKRSVLKNALRKSLT